MSKDVYILAIESSCDETSCSIVKNGNEIVSNIVSSQINIHKEFNGVIPEVASRIHVENISLVINKALEKASMKVEDVDAIAFTKGPGLIGCLHIGNQAAKTLAFLYQKPLIGIHHITGHIYANNFVTDIEYPLLALVVSGGHSELVYIESEYNFKVIGETMDDAIGEAYDKVARLLGLPYPGGPEIDKLAKLGKPIYQFPKVKMDGEFDFSFSGLKSASLQLKQRLLRKNEEFENCDIACSFQEAVLGQLMDRTKKAIDKLNPKMLVLAGGVAANSRLRELVLNDLQTKFPQVKMFVPPLWCCTDNAAMIGASGYVAFKHHLFDDYDVASRPSIDIEDVTCEKN
ncbi:MAG: tRNA (adenosine(37)-N6)-threonylcarbamoyltransferase complex transferase subunit TsaD [Erysipelotrichaceae bacterium]